MAVATHHTGRPKVTQQVARGAGPERLVAKHTHQPVEECGETHGLQGRGGGSWTKGGRGEVALTGGTRPDPGYHWTKKCDPAHAPGGAACSLTTSVTLPMRLMLAVCMLL